MGMGSSLAALALAALLSSFLAVGGAVEEYNTTDLTPSGAGLNDSAATKYWGPWLPARATWYGQPEGAGPDDNGEKILHIPALSSGSTLLVRAMRLMHVLIDLALQVVRAASRM